MKFEDLMRIVKYIYFCFIMNITGFLPDLKMIMALRGLLLKPCFKKCGKRFQIGSNVVILHSSRVSIGDDVYIAHGSWIEGSGEINIADEVMLGPYTILSASNHTKTGNSFRYGKDKVGKIVIQKGSWTGAHVVITAGVNIGEGVVCAAGSVVVNSMPSGVICGGVPAKIINKEINNE